MKKLFVSLLAILNILMLQAQTNITTKSLSIRFNESNYEYLYNDSLLSISSRQPHFTYSTNISAPAIPYQPLYVLIGKNHQYVSHQLYASKRTIFNQKRMNCVPDVFSNTSQSINITGNTYASSLAESVIFTGEKNMDAYKLLCFLVTPFSYDNLTANVSFTDTINIDIQLEIKNDTRNISFQNHDNGMKNIVKQLVINSEDFQTLYPEHSSTLPTKNNQEKFEYLIITHDSLVNSFKPLIEWKKIKGLSAKIVTISSIKAQYTGFITNRIKNFLKDCKDFHSTKYVLLGGDDIIVPVQKCYCKLVTNVIEEDNTIPTDLFYSCLEGDLTWNSNGNDKIGEVEDSIDLTPSISLSRVPLRTSKQVESFVERVIKYEQTLRSEDFKMLSCAVIAEVMATTSKSDAHVRSEYMYNTCIAPFWNGNYYRFYDTGTDFIGGENYDVTALHLQEQLKKGYDFVHVNTHGVQNKWKMEGNDHYYYAFQAGSLENEGFTLITTNACLTSDFNNMNYPECLCERFIRNEHSGITGYIGYIRKSYHYRYNNNDNSPDMTPIGDFYKFLFETDSIAKIMDVYRMAISQNIASVQYEYNISRWNYMCLSYMGDPEMNIYFKRPPMIPSISMRVTNNNLTVLSNESIDTLQISIRDTATDSLSFYTYTGTEVDINIPDSCIVYFTHRNRYAPSILSIINNNVYFQNNLIGNDWIINAPKVLLGDNNNPILPTGPTIIDRGNVNIENSNEVILDRGFEIKKGATFKVLHNRQP